MEIAEDQGVEQNFAYLMSSRFIYFLILHEYLYVPSPNPKFGVNEGELH
jgi:hypothetical protein